MGNIENHGYFEVVFVVEKGGMVARLTGKHYLANESWSAAMACKASIRDAIGILDSPVYLVEDKVVRFAMQSMENAIAAGFADCHDGEKGANCGECQSCMAAKDEVFTRVMMMHVDLPVGYEFVRQAVGSTIGSTRVDIQWEEDMTSEEVSKVFAEFNIKER